MKVELPGRRTSTVPLTGARFVVFPRIGAARLTCSEPTVAVLAEVAAVPPAAFDAVTVARSVCPASAAAGTYLLAVAPAIEEQLAPVASQRSHWRAKEVGEPAHVPLE